MVDNNFGKVKIKIIGVGGGGNNTINSMIQEGITGVDFVAVNTDKQALDMSLAETKLNIGKESQGLGAGANPGMGKKYAIESEDTIRNMLDGAHMAIIAAGMGGGTGTGASPIISKIAKELGILTIGIVTTPFTFEGSKRAENARKGIAEIKNHVDSMVVVSNDKLLKQFGGVSLKDSFLYADKVLKQAARTISDLITIPSMINLDFADVVTVMKNKGSAIIGIGRASGKDRAVKAAVHAISSPILTRTIDGAKDAIVNISGGDLTLDEANKVVETIQASAGNDINIIFGVSMLSELNDEIQVSVIATGIDELDKEFGHEEIKESVSNSLLNLDIEFDDEKTKEFLIENPLPEEEKMHITEEVELQGITPITSVPDDEDETDELPDFLRD